jgi:hypothetical protein
MDNFLLNILHPQQLEDFNSVLEATGRAAKGMSWVHLPGTRMPVFFTVPDEKIFVLPRFVRVLPELPQKRLCH